MYEYASTRHYSWGSAKNCVQFPIGGLLAWEAALRKIIRSSHFGPNGRSTGISLQARPVDRAACGDRRLPTRPCAHGGR
jgi:hypothetical protein